ncbi:MAG: hypothetical protein ACK5OR_00940 [Betaproteobacteria bacterium]
MDKSFAQRLLWVLWPSFLVAAVAELFLFAVFDPADLHLFGSPVQANRMTVYAAGFFLIWAATAAASALTVFLQRSPFEVNRCPVEPTERPPGCPKRAGGECDGGTCAPQARN